MDNRAKLIAGAFLAVTLCYQQDAHAFFQQLEDSIRANLKQKEQARQRQQRGEAPVVPQQHQAWGIATKAVNLRSGPGTQYGKMVTLPLNSLVLVLDAQGNWLKVNATLASGNTIEGWVYKPLFRIYQTDPRSPQLVQPAQPAATAQPRQIVQYAGYSKEFQQVKQMLGHGNLVGVERFYAEKEEEVLKKNSNQSRYRVIQSIGLLRWMERGTLHLDQGNLGKSMQAFANAESILEVRKSGSKAGDTAKSGLAFLFETLTGNEEIQEYPGEGYEKVLMLNYKSIVYLLNGERKAYNVARRAIDWQNREKEFFRQEIEKAKQEMNKQNNTGAHDGWAAKYRELDQAATRVPSAFVNPFGYYVTGMIQEFESKDDRSLRDNARISYSKALELNPQSKVLQQAVADTKAKKAYGNKRLVHIVVADGFVPEKKMLVYQIPTSKGPLPIKLPLYDPVPSGVKRIEVQTADGKRLTTLSPVADVEAICLRHQKDTEPFRMLRVALAVARSAGINAATEDSGFVGQLIKTAANEMAAPDMRSWMSLPSNIQAARLYVGKNVKNLKIVSYDEHGRSLAAKMVAVAEGSDAFIYARSIENQMHVNESKTLWVASN